MTHRMSDPEFARDAREPRSPAIEALEEQLAALDRITAKHPELADHNARRKERIKAEINQLNQET